MGPRVQTGVQEPAPGDAACRDRVGPEMGGEATPPGSPGSRPAVHPVTESQLCQIVRYVEAAYPEEACGIVIGRPGHPETYRIRPVTNIANQRPQRDPTGVDRDARTAYRMDDREVLKVLREADDAGVEVVTFFHSHPDHDAYFSAMDRERALTPQEEPLWPGATYLVVSVHDGRARESRYFAWSDQRRDFAEMAADRRAS